MAVKITKLTDETMFKKACASTSGKSNVKTSLKSGYKTEHSPIRTQIFWVEMTNIPTFVSVHLVRHKIGVDHYVLSQRDDRVNAPQQTPDRDTPINHSMLINAQALIFMARKRLCYKAHKRTIAIMTRIRNTMKTVDPALYNYLVPECVYRNGLCPEQRQCELGVERVMKIYSQAPYHTTEPPIALKKSPNIV